MYHILKAKKNVHLLCLKKRTTYYQLIIQLTFSVTLLLVCAKPIVCLIDQLVDNNSDIELVEDFDEEESEFDEVLICSQNLTIESDITSVKKNSSQYIFNQYIDVYKDILIPPPKHII